MSTYTEFLSRKKRRVPSVGVDNPGDVHPMLFDFQRDIVQWACRRGRAAVFADCGMGKTLMQLEWARLMGGPALIVAPLSVTTQTAREAEKVGLRTECVRRPYTDDPDIIRIVNYENVGKIDTSGTVSVVLDESSILKNSAGKTRKALIDQFASTRYRLACTATPSPNDHEELTNHAEFLGVARRVEVLANFFVHDQDGWRLKRHGMTDFYDWVATWAVSCKRPSDLGYDDHGFILPDLNIRSDIVPSDAHDGLLFGSELGGVQGRSRERRGTIDARISQAVAAVNGSDDQCIVWCGLNEESSRAAASCVGAVEVTGSMSADEKETALQRFLDGDARVLVTKPRICGFGLNLQNCHRQVFLGIGDSYESYYQCIRRSWRFGQDNPVSVTVVHSEAEGTIVENVARKERDADALSDALVERCAVAGYVGRKESMEDTDQLEPTGGTEAGHDWNLTNGDCVDVMRAMGEGSVDMSIYSPPFASLFTYSDSPRDMGNCTTMEEFAEHFAFFPPELLRITKPGRLTVVHCQQIASTQQNHGQIGILDFRGLLLGLFKDAGWIHHGEVTVDKCPQAQAIRTKAKSLLFVQKERDSSWLRPGLADYLLVFRAPGENAVPILNDDVTREDWIEWARPVWYGIRESNTLNVAEARGEKDERHICPLQLDLIERAIMLWSNRGDTVFSPFAGIGSEGYVAVEKGRVFRGAELKPEYFKIACKNLGAAERSRDQLELFT